MRRWLITLLQCVAFLHSWGERATPWNIATVWPEVRNRTDFYRIGQGPFG